MSTQNRQQVVYDELYSTSQYEELNLPDYKITDHKKIKNKKILVLGIGTAKDTKHLAGNNEVWGVDSSRKAVNHIKKYRIKGILADLEGSIKGIRKNYFDIVVAKDILEHLCNPEILIRQINEVLKEDGYAIINVPNHFYFPFRLRILFGGNLLWKSIGHDHTKLFKEWNYMHKMFFTWKGYKKFLEIYGFKITKTFWDFGNLAHYSQPETVFEYLSQTKSLKEPQLKMLKGAWSVFNVIFPKRLRSVIVGVSPGLLCSSFYVRCKPKKH